jgi:hypothetical protein
MEMKITQTYLKSYKDYIILILSIITPNLKLISNWNVYSFGGVLLTILLLIITGVLSTSICAFFLNYIVDWFEGVSYRKGGEESKMDRRTRIKKYFLIVSVINIILFLVSGNTINNFLLG